MAQGYFRVNGHATFTDCDNDNILDSCPGLGGAIYNGPDGSILFKGGVTVQDMFINVSVVNSHAQYIRACMLFVLFKKIRKTPRYLKHEQLRTG